METMMLGVYKIPEITINSGIDWLGICGIVLTALIVVLGTWTTIKNFKNTTLSQEAVAEATSNRQFVHIKAENVAKNRQEWINGLRSEISNFISACFDVRSVYLNQSRPTGLVPELFEDFVTVENLERELKSKLIAAQGEARRCLSLIELYINPEEQASIDLVKTAQEIFHRAGDTSFNLTWECDDLVKIAQGILKCEWERVKQMV
ncbi:hypothetical protein AQS70_03400 [Pseudomonas endophytica]|uniref:Uncharacterized protein n=2 Tax=Pseudomonas endophytica TaxID=1563157 RepID=A0A0N8VSA2_9PSED|nr:hypothetical protein AQS70_03400 [Pseudomonas endophytica]